MMWLISFDTSDFDGIAFTMQVPLSKLIVLLVYNWLHEKTFVLHVQTKALISCIFTGCNVGRFQWSIFSYFLDYYLLLCCCYM